MTKRSGADGPRRAGEPVNEYLRVLQDAVERGAITIVDNEPTAPPADTTPRALLEARGWPTRSLDFAEKAHDTHAIRVMREHGEREGVIVLSGEKGSGKTVGAAWWAMHRARPTRFMRASALARLSRYASEREELYTNCRALVLDDVGAEYADEKGSFVSDLDELVDVFYADRRKLVITTNCTGKQFLERYGERIADRLAECGKWVFITDTSMRPTTRVPWDDG